jgi:hypothetical protein
MASTTLKTDATNALPDAANRYLKYMGFTLSLSRSILTSACKKPPGYSGNNRVCPTF